MNTRTRNVVVFTGERKAELLSEAIPEGLQPDQIRIRTEFSLISPGTELSWYSGIQRDVAGNSFSYPVYTGYCNVGEVIETGPEPGEISVGDLVISGSGHSSEVILSTTPTFEFQHGDLGKPLHAVPAGLPAELAPFAKMAEIAMTSVRISDFSLGEKVLVLGQGMVGNLAAQLFQLSGADVLAVDISEFRLEKSRECGIRNTLNSASDNLETAVLEWTDGFGADVTVESIGSSELILEAISLTRRLGDLILLGTPRRKADLNPSPSFWKAHMKGISLKGALRSLFYPLYPAGFNRRSVLRDLSLALRLMADNDLKTRPLLSGRYQPEACGKAYEDLFLLKDRAIGVLFDWREKREERL